MLVALSLSAQGQFGQFLCVHPRAPCGLCLRVCWVTPECVWPRDAGTFAAWEENRIQPEGSVKTCARFQDAVSGLPKDSSWEGLPDPSCADQPPPPLRGDVHEPEEGHRTGKFVSEVAMEKVAAREGSLRVDRQHGAETEAGCVGGPGRGGSGGPQPREEVYGGHRPGRGRGSLERDKPQPPESRCPAGSAGPRGPSRTPAQGPPAAQLFRKSLGVTCPAPPLPCPCPFRGPPKSRMLVLPSMWLVAEALSEGGLGWAPGGWGHTAMAPHWGLGARRHLEELGTGWVPL